MLNIDEIQNGLVIDHIKAGTAIGLMDLLGIKGNRTSSVALIQNARSHKAESGRKDIIKVEGDASRRIFPSRTISSAKFLPCNHSSFHPP